MARVEVKWRQAGFREARTSPKVLAELVKRAERIAAASGEGFEVDSGVTGGRGRARASVRTATRAAVVKNARDNTLLRNLDAGRG